MLILLSPAKTLDFDPAPIKRHSQPRMLDQTDKLVGIMRTRTSQRLQELMKISEAIADLNVQRYKDYSSSHALDENSKQALLAFKGDVYRNWGWADYTDEDFEYAQSRIRILSGLYGVLRPLDLMQPYRLEMGTKLENQRGKSLYDFWGMRITDVINGDIAQVGAPAVINLASNEYFHSVKSKKLSVPVVTPVFKDKKRDVYKIISFYAKQARGAMADWAVKHRASTPADLMHFNGMGYRYCPERSTESHPTFIREPEG